VGGLALGHSRIARGTATGWICTLIGWILVAKGGSAGAAGGR